MQPKAHTFIRRQLPEYLDKEAPGLAKLMESYYEFLENGGSNSPLGFVRAALRERDIDTASSVFKSYIKRNILPNLPVDGAVIDDVSLLKHIRELISTKGTSQSYQHVMQLFFDENARTKQMSDFVLRASDNKATTTTTVTLKSEPQYVDGIEFVGASIVQQGDDVAAAFVDNAVQIPFDGLRRIICEIRPDTVYGVFQGDFVVHVKPRKPTTVSIQGFNQDSESSIRTDNFVRKYGVTVGMTATVSGKIYTVLNAVDTEDGGVVTFDVPISIAPNTTVAFYGMMELPLLVDNVLGDVELDNAGSLYREELPLLEIGGSGEAGDIIVDEVGAGSVDGFLVVRRGTGYAVGDPVTVLSDSVGDGAIGVVSAIDGTDATIEPVMKVGAVTVRSGGYGYKVGQQVRLDIPGASPAILNVTGVTTNAAYVDITSGGYGYTYARPLFKVGSSYYQGAAKISNGRVVSVSLPGTSLASQPDLFLNGSGGYGQFTVSGNTISGAITVTSGGVNYVSPRLKFYSNVAKEPHQEISPTNTEFAFTLGANNTVSSIAVVAGGYFPSNGTVHFKIVESTGDGFEGNVVMGGAITSVSIFTAGSFSQSTGNIKAYNIGSSLYRSDMKNTSATFDVTYNVDSAVVTNPGRGYTADGVSVTDIGGKGSGASLLPVIEGGAISGIIVLDGGVNYQSNLLLSIDGDGTGATISPVVVDGTIKSVTVTAGGSGYTTASVVFGFRGAGLVCGISVAPNGSIGGVKVLNGGTGYFQASPLEVVVGDPTSPSLTPGGSGYTFAAVNIYGNGSGAQAVAVIEGGSIKRITMISKGKGYTSATVDLVGNGTGAYAVPKASGGAIQSIDLVTGSRAIARAVVASGVVQSIYVVDPGFGYTSSPSITFTGGAGSGAAAGLVTVNTTTKGVTSIALAAGGSGYRYGTKVVIEGEGSGADVTAIVNTGITRAEIIDGGAGYFNPHILVYEGSNKSSFVEAIQGKKSKPVKTVSLSGVTGTFSVGQTVFVGANYSASIKRAIISSVTPTELKYYLPDSWVVDLSAGDFIRNESLTASATIGIGSGADLFPVIKNGSVQSISIISAGSGYVNGSKIKFAFMDGEGAEATITTDPLDSNKVTKVTVNKGGTGYNSFQYISVTQWLENTIVFNGQRLFQDDRQYEVTSGGITGSTAPVHTSGSASNGTATLSYMGLKTVPSPVCIMSGAGFVSGKIEGISGSLIGTKITVEGNSYVSPSAIVYNDIGNSLLTPTISAGGVSSIAVTVAGSGYTTTPTARIIGNGTGATATAILSGNKLSSVTVNTPGSGYTWAHAVIEDGYGNGKAQVVVFADRPIKSCTVNNPGSGYTNAIAYVLGDGQSATVSASVAGNGEILGVSTNAATMFTTYPSIKVSDTSNIGAVSKVSVVNRGNGYKTLPVAKISGGDGGALVIPTSSTIGRVVSTRNRFAGYGYDEVPLVAFPLIGITTEMTNQFIPGERVYVKGFNYGGNLSNGPTARVSMQDASRNLLELIECTEDFIISVETDQGEFDLQAESDELLLHEYSNAIRTGDIIVGEYSGVQAKILWSNRASGSVDNVGMARYKTEFASESGYLSTRAQRLTDSYKYHDYAFSVGTGLSMKTYENVLRSMVHPAGYKIFGEVIHEFFEEVSVSLPTTDRGEAIDTPAISLLFSLFSSVFLASIWTYRIQSLANFKINELAGYTIDEIMSDILSDQDLYNKFRTAVCYCEVKVNP